MNSRSIKLLAALFFTITLNSQPAFAADENSVSTDFVKQHFKLKKPEGKGPFPAMIFISGCSGYKWTDIAYAHYNNTAEKFVAKGYAVIMVDFLVGTNNVNCIGIDFDLVLKKVRLTHDYLQQLAFIDKENINLFGWSFGGIVTIQIANIEPFAKRFKKAVAYYPRCSSEQKWQSHIPILIQSGSLDDVTPFMPCRNLIDNSPDSSMVKFRVIPDGRHAFDFVGYPEKKDYIIGTIGYNEKAAKKAWRNVERFMFR